MANEDIKEELQKLRIEQRDADERKEIAKEVNRLRSMKWEREHPRLARLNRFFGRE